MTRLIRAGFVLLFVLAGVCYQLAAQAITEQKEVVAFLFGTVHPLNTDKKPMKDSNGHAVAVESPLGTGFLVNYPDPRGGPTYGFAYLVTAKHVLRDFDGSSIQTESANEFEETN